jgi:hypothetical protein
MYVLGHFASQLENHPQKDHFQSEWRNDCKYQADIMSKFLSCYKRTPTSTKCNPTAAAAQVLAMHPVLPGICSKYPSIIIQ